FTDPGNDVSFRYAEASGFRPANSGSQFDKYYRLLYGLVNRANYVIENIETNTLPMANPEALEGLERVVGEARMLRAMGYFRLISLWGDVPYFSKIISNNEEVTSLARVPIGQVKDSIMA